MCNFATVFTVLVVKFNLADTTASTDLVARLPQLILESLSQFLESDATGKTSYRDLKLYISISTVSAVTDNCICNQKAFHLI